MFKRLRKQKIEDPEELQDSNPEEEQETQQTQEIREDPESTEQPETVEAPESSTDADASPSWREGFEKWVAEQQISPEDANQLSSTVTGLLQALAAGGNDLIFSLIEKGLNYDNDVEQARSEGEVAGRNARIDELREIEQASDGVPHPGVYPCAAGGIRTPNIFDLAAQA